MYALITIYSDEITKRSSRYTYKDLQQEYSEKEYFDTLESVLSYVIFFLNIEELSDQNYYFVVNEETEEIIYR